VALIAFAYWLKTGTRLACRVTTVTPGSSLNSHAAGAQITRTCGLPDVSNFVYVLAVVSVLLLPDARSIKIGALSFERLTAKVEQQTREISRLTANVNQTVNLGASIADELRAAIRQQRQTLDDLHAHLAADAEAVGKLGVIDDIYRRLDQATLPELLGAATAAAELIRGAREDAEQAVVRSVAVSETDATTALDAEEVLRQVAPPRDDQPADSDQS
jgi:hypothetical protein